MLLIEFGLVIGIGWNEQDNFSTDEKSTIGVEFATRVVPMADGKLIKAQIWDTGTIPIQTIKLCKLNDGLIVCDQS